MKNKKILTASVLATIFFTPVAAEIILAEETALLGEESPSVTEEPLILAEEPLTDDGSQASLEDLLVVGPQERNADILVSDDSPRVNTQIRDLTDKISDLEGDVLALEEQKSLTKSHIGDIPSENSLFVPETDMEKILQHLHQILGDVKHTLMPVVNVKDKKSAGIISRAEASASLAWRLFIMPQKGIIDMESSVEKNDHPIAKTPGGSEKTPSPGGSLEAWGVGVGPLTVGNDSQGSGMGLGVSGYGQQIYTTVIRSCRKIVDLSVQSFGPANLKQAIENGGTVADWNRGAAAKTTQEILTIEQSDSPMVKSSRIAVSLAGYLANKCVAGGFGTSLWEALKAVENVMKYGPSKTIVESQGNFAQADTKAIAIALAPSAPEKLDPSINGSPERIYNLNEVQ